MDTCVAGLHTLRAMGAQAVVCTSSDIAYGKAGHITAVAAVPWERASSAACRAMWGAQWGTGKAAVFSVQVPKIDSKFTGTGDLTAALLLARAAEFPDDMPRAVCIVMASLHVVCKATAEAPASQVGPLRELRLVPCIEALRSPPDLFEANPYIAES